MRKIHPSSLLLCLLVLLVGSSVAQAQLNTGDDPVVAASDKAVSFTDIGAGLITVAHSWVEWGDYDNDGDLDLVIMGSWGYPNFYTRIYRNDAGVFTDIVAGLPGLRYGSARWGDYDNDGDIDLLVTGTYVSGKLARIYRNDAGVFTDIVAGLPGWGNSVADWGDYDNDGDLDILVSGESGYQGMRTEIYRNDSGVFVAVYGTTYNPLIGSINGSAEWGDYDNDGDLDILLVGADHIFTTSWSQVVRNDAGVFTDIIAGLPGAMSGAWGDYDNDGDLDILLTGTNTGGSSRVYRNDAGTFNVIAGTLQHLIGESTWGDYDNDGDLDILMMGAYDYDPYTKIYRNDAGSFVDTNEALTLLYNGCAAWGDYDSDGDLDILMTGVNSMGHHSIIYRNDSTVANTPPHGPTKIDAVRVGSQVTFSWFATSDTHTPQAGLQYNLRVGTTPGAGDIVSPMSSGTDGHRRVARRGNCGHATSRTVTIAPGTTYFWAVQAIDTAFEGSPFAFEDTDFESFTDIGVGLPQVGNGAVKWGDYDNDGDLDIAIIGWSGSVAASRILRNNGGTFSQLGAGLVNVSNGDLDWGDFDNDGDLDLILAGGVGAGAGATRIYRNDGGVFTDAAAALPDVWRGSTDWGDYDNDGDLDVLLTGLDVAYSWFSRVYRNDAGVFSDIGAGLVGVFDSDAEWGDYDNDGDLDLVLCGMDGFTETSKVYRNDGGSFTDIGAAVGNMWNASVDWGDYDNDGDLDILMSGTEGSAPRAHIYRNTAGIFADIGPIFLGIEYGSAQWGDYDNDGDLDFLLTGYNNYDVEWTMLYRNEGGAFVRITSGLPDLQSAAAAWGDYDNDGDLDILLSGYVGGGYQAGIHRNNTTTANTPPNPPSNLQAQLLGTRLLRFSWSPPADGQTPTSGLSYNLRVGTSPGASNLYSSMADLSSGWRRLAQRGHIQATSLEFPFSGVGPVYWSVQAVDHGFAGSAFSVNPGPVSATDDAVVPGRTSLRSNVPNPFNPITRIDYTVKQDVHVRLVIYDARGREIATLVDEYQAAQERSVSWDGRNRSGDRVASGVYFYKLFAGDFEETRKMALVK